MDKLAILKQLARENTRLVDKANIPVSLGRSRIEIVSFPEALELTRLLVELENKKPFGKWRSGARQVRENLKTYTDGLLASWLELAARNIDAGEWILSPFNGLEELENDRRKLQH